MPKSKVSAALSLLLVFVSGALVGVLAHRAYVTSAATASPNLPRPKRDPADFRKHFIQSMRDRVKLDDQQVAKLNEIMDGVDVRIREINERRRTENLAIRKSMVEQINAMLRPDQQPLYAQFQEERERERQKEMMQGRGGHPPGPPPEEKK